MTKREKREEGFVAIVVAALIMVILSLITIGFTRMMQREQQQALDRQLTRQALYAAESGINDVYEGLRSGALTAVEKTECDVTDTTQFPNGGVISETGNVAYTCALYDKTPTELIYSISTSESKVAQLITESGNAFSSLRIRWANEEGLNNVSALPSCGTDANIFPTSRSGNIPMLRIDLTDTTVLSRDALIGNTDYLYVAPCNGTASSTHSFPSATNGSVVQVSCIDGQDLPCTLTINNLSSTTYVARIRSVYDSAQLTIDGLERVGAGTAEVNFDQSQTSIDVTARANDVVRRLRVSIPVAQPDNPPEAVFQSFDGVCKLLEVDTSIPATPRIKDSCS
jgi:Tfp pilus assembly protein PilX